MFAIQLLTQKAALLDKPSHAPRVCFLLRLLSGCAYILNSHQFQIPPYHLIPLIHYNINTPSSL